MRSNTKTGTNLSFILHAPWFLPHFAAWGPARPLNQPNRASGAGDGCDSAGAVRLRLAQATRTCFRQLLRRARTYVRHRRSGLISRKYEPLVEPEATSRPLILGRQGIVGDESRRQRPVNDGSDPLVVVEIALTASGKALDRVGMESVRLDELARRVPRREHRHQRSLLPADGELDVLLGADRVRELLAQVGVVLAEDVFRPGVVPDGGREPLRDQLEVGDRLVRKRVLEVGVAKLVQAVDHRNVREGIELVEI